MSRRFYFLLITLFTNGLLLAQTVHTVQHGETFELIASHYGIDEALLRETNPSVENCHMGMKLNVPQDSVSESRRDCMGITDPRFVQAIDLMEKQEYKKAEKLFSLLIKESPTAQLYYYRGECNYERKKYKTAMKDFEQAMNMKGLAEDERKKCQKLLLLSCQQHNVQLIKRAKKWGGSVAAAAVMVGTVASPKGKSKAIKDNNGTPLDSIKSSSPSSSH